MLNVGLKFMILTDSRTLHPLSQPGAPKVLTCNKGLQTSALNESMTVLCLSHS